VPFEVADLGLRHVAERAQLRADRELSEFLVGAFVRRERLNVIDGLPSWHRCGRYNAIARAIKAMFGCRLVDMPVLAEHTVSTVRPHGTYDVRGGGGMVQTVPWNIPANGDIRFSDGLGDGAVFGGLGALTDAEIQQLAERIKNATFASDVQAILEIVPTIAERQAVASRAVAIGADPSHVQQAMVALERSAGLKGLFKPPSMPVRIVWGVLSTASFAASVYHGYKRNDSVGWAIWWGFMGALFPVITPTIAFAQGFGQPKRSGLGRSYRRRGAGRRRNRRS
jgi:hypothetical protein